MEDTKKTTPVDPEENKSDDRSEISISIPSFNWKKWLTPLAIVFSAFLISGSIVYAFSPSYKGKSDNSDNNSSISGDCKGDNRFSEECYVEFASAIDINTDDFAACFEERRFDQLIDDELVYGETVGVKGTPSVYIAKKDGDSVRGFYVYGARATDIQEIVDYGEKKSIKEIHSYWQKLLLESLKDYRVSAENFYKSAEGGELSGDELKNAVNEAVSLQEQDIKTSTQLQDLEIGDGAVKGDENAEIIVMEFSDYECPFCQSYAAEQLPEIEESLIDTGKVQLVFRDFPLEQIHFNARDAALAARCAGDQGAYWEYHDMLFEI